jgi:tetratricopeptide (TPR) repeat protein
MSVDVASRVSELRLRAAVCARLVLAPGEGVLGDDRRVVEDERGLLLSRHPAVSPESVPADVDRALALLGKAAFLAPDDGMVFVRRGEVYQSIGDVRSALGCFRRAAALLPDATWARRQVALALDAQACLLLDRGESGRALTLLNEALELEARVSGIWMHRALLYLERGSLAKVVGDLNRYLELAEWDCDALVLRGKLLWRLGMVDKSNRDMAAARELDPQHPEVERFQVSVRSEAASENESAGRLMAQGDFSHALKQLRAALRQQPDSARLGALAASCARRLGDLDGAEALILVAQRGLEAGIAAAGLAHNSSTANNGGASKRLAALRRDADEVAREHALVLNDRVAQLLAGRAEGDTEDAARALRAISLALAMCPRLGVLYMHRGDCHRVRGEWAASLADYREALRLEPDDRPAIAARLAVTRYNMALDAFNHHRVHEAEEHIAESVRLEPRVAEYRSTRGLVRSTLGDMEGAHEDFYCALALDPANDRARCCLGNQRTELPELTVFLPPLDAHKSHLLGRPWSP